LDFKGIEAYFVKVKSKNLRKKLFEIVLLDYDNIILHSKSEAILKHAYERKCLHKRSKKFPGGQLHKPEVLGLTFFIILLLP